MLAGIESGSIGARVATGATAGGGGATVARAGDGRAPVLAAAPIVSAFESDGPTE
jgi:hypothetical protein